MYMSPKKNFYFSPRDIKHILLSLFFLLPLFSLKAQEADLLLSQISQDNQEEKIPVKQYLYSSDKSKIHQKGEIYISEGVIVHNADLIFSQPSKDHSVDMKRSLKKNTKAKYASNTQIKEKQKETFHRKVVVMAFFKPIDIEENYFFNSLQKNNYIGTGNNSFKKVISITGYHPELPVFFYYRQKAYAQERFFSQNKYFLNKSCIRPPTNVILSFS